MQRSAGQEQPSFRVESEQGLPSLTLEVLDVLRFIQDHVVPFLSPEREVVLYD